MSTSTERIGLIFMISCKQTIYTGKTQVFGDQPHSGDFIWSLSHLMNYNQPVCYYINCETEELYDQLRSLAVMQPYIHTIARYSGESVDLDFDNRNRYDTSRCICDIYGSNDPRKAWLSGGKSGDYDVISRNLRYQSQEFNWKVFKKTIDLSKCIFIGSHEEYLSFRVSACIPKSKLEWIETPTYADLYRVISMCNTFYGNGGLPSVLAHGFQKKVVLEIELHKYPPHTPIIHNVMNSRSNEYYTHYNITTIKTIENHQ